MFRVGMECPEKEIRVIRNEMEYARTVSAAGRKNPDVG